jgi:deoxyribodipyrimidine photolyase-related protein
MEHFYRHMRRRHRLLLDADGQPEGGQWNFDHDNRKPWPGTPPSRPTGARTRPQRAVGNAAALRCGKLGRAAGRSPALAAEPRRGAGCLEAFITQALPHFGDYEDAMASQAPRLFHSLLSFALNVKMLHPLEVVPRAEAAWRGGQAPLAAVEGFVRQILGWREYVRGIYWACMPGYENRNAGPPPAAAALVLDGRHAHALPAAVHRQSLQTAHAHHIQRLMVIGNFALLAGLDPVALHRWYLGIYIDAFEWVELPNTLGMSQRADGGLIATKPYVSSAAYLQRMGDYCQGCAYDPKQRRPARLPLQRPVLGFFDRHAPLCATTTGWRWCTASGRRCPRSSRRPCAQARSCAGGWMRCNPTHEACHAIASTGYRAIVIGASGAIGGAMAAQLSADPRCAEVCALSRRSDPAVDLDAGHSIASAAQALRIAGPGT